MDRMSFIPGPKAKAEIHEAEGRVFFNRAAALDYADEFIWNAAGSAGLAHNPHTRLLYALVGACLSEGDLVDVYFGLRGPDAAAGEKTVESEEEEERARRGGEDIGHTWAVLTHADGRTQTVWEVGRDTPYPREVFARRAFNGYRQALAEYKQTAAPQAVPVVAEEAGNERAGEGGEAWPRVFRDKPVASRALAPANLYRASARMWYFVDFAPPGQVDEAAVLSRPVRAFDALILSTLVTLAYGAPAQVFGVRYRLENIGQMPSAYLRTQYEANEDLREQTDEEILLVM
ncbi:hypothetical protein V2A60_003066 [Cordyceps javanica]|uniref:Uncharacterized protein n=1 Tax=Cordyceps javanica TaxID=43265 RepID=A0A545W1P6_9HYPO|nr:hypothetical protein IF1G_05128 [Cordyceps javanica]TQW07825.1 hypothetical protein IF2G_04986 [Cordyceps javanica]